MAFHPTKNLLASCSVDKSVKLWNTDTGTELWTVTGHGDWVRSVSWSPDGAKLASGSDDKTVRIWEVATGKELSQLRVDSMVMCLSYAPSGDMLAVGDYDGNIHFFNAQGEKLQSPVRGHSAVGRSVCFSSDGKKLTSGSEDSTVRNWDPATRASLS